MMLCKPQIEFAFSEKSLQNDESIFSGPFIDPSWQVFLIYLVINSQQ